ncbi:MAG: MraY family glycosyltransferase [bacterium]
MIERLAIAPFILSLVMSLALTSITIQIYRAFGWVDKSTKKDHPKNIHTEPVPRGGGIPIYGSMLLTILLLVPFDQHMAGIIVGATILLILGVLDDVCDISPYWRLFFGSVVALIVVLSGIGINYMSSPAGGILHLNQWISNISVFGHITTISWIADALAMLWIVWCMNFVNMGAKGLDGQLPGVVVIASIVMGILSFRFANDITAWPSTAVAFALAGSFAGLLLFNVYPQKIMPGWGGGSLAGYFLAVLAILSGAKVATAIIVLGVPLMDVSYAIVRRIISGKSPVWGDDKHLHHKLLQIGWTKRQVAGFYWLVTAILGVIALKLDARAKVYAIIMLAVLVGGLLLWINLFLSQRRQESLNG